MELTEFLARKQTRQTETGKKSKDYPFSRLLATGMGVGYLPLAPGTWGAIQGIGLVCLLQLLSASTALLLHVFLIAILFIFGLISAARVSRADGITDPMHVVVDEILGQMLCLVFVPFSPVALLAGFFLFRLLDIVKPYPARRCELMPGGWGIIMDDVVAGIYSGLATFLIIWLVQIWF